LEEKLSENAYHKILPARYLRKDENGEVIETPEEIFDRIASNIALADIIHYKRDGKPMTLTKGRTPMRVTEHSIKRLSYEELEEELTEAEREDYLATKEKFKGMMENLDFIPNTPTLMNAGDELQQLSACFVLSPEDDIDDIHDKARKAALIFQSGGGCGYSFSRLRPYGDKVGSTGGIASGPITFMRTYDQMCETIAQGGARRGAQMGIMRIDHPDIVEFIHAKNKDVSLAHALKLNDPDDPEHVKFSDALEEARNLIDEKGRVPKYLRNAVEGHLSNFNISVGVTNEFMEALENERDYALINPRTGKPHVATPYTVEMWERYGLGEYIQEGEEMYVPAEAVWKRIIQGAHQNGEPGVVFLDKINEMHSFDVEEYPEYEILATNPCGEQPLMEFEACNLGHINLSTLKKKGVGVYDGQDLDSYLSDAIDWREFDQRIEAGVHFLDNVVTMSHFPVQEIRERVRDTRKIGLGIMGLAQLFVQLGIPYDSREAVDTSERLMKHLNFVSKEVSHELAVKRGSFADWDKSKYANPTKYPYWFKYHTGHEPDDWKEGFPIRNHNTTTIAPTGTTGMIANTSGGCEPIYNVAYFKNVSDDVQGEEMLVEFDDYFLDVLKANNVDVDSVKEEAIQQMNNNSFIGVNGLSEIPSDIREIFVVADEVHPTQHAMIQTACQRGVDSAISKTINAPNNADLKDADRVFRKIYREGGKGVTYYRDGSRSKQVLTTRKDNSEFSQSEELEKELERLEAELESERASRPAVESYCRERPNTLESVTHRVQTGYGSLYVTVTLDENGNPFEVFANMGNSGGFTASFVEAIGKLCSISLRHGVPPEDVAGILSGIRSPQISWDQGTPIQSVPDAISVAIERTLKGEEGEVEIEQLEAKSDGGITEAESLVKSGHNPECLECGAMSLSFAEGCKKCESCGWSEC